MTLPELARTRSDTALRSLWDPRALLAVAMAALLLACVPGRSYASAPHAGLRWTASAELLTVSHGQWRPTTAVDSLGVLRGVLTVHGQGLTGNRVTATMEIMHLSWQGFTKVILPPSVSVRMRRASVSRGEAVFTVDAQVPTLLPVFWSVVRFAVTDGHAHVTVDSGIMVGGPAKQTRFNTLTVPEAHAFCAAHSPLPYLRYAVYLHGYFLGINSGGDGPPQGIVLDRPRRVGPAVLRDPSYPYGVRTGGFGLPGDGWATTPGLLDCADRKPTQPIGFTANP